MGIKQSWIYPRDGGPPCLKADYKAPETPYKGYAVLGDLPDFVSPIDNKVYHGRAGLREHNLRHDVVPVADLKGLPYLTTNSDTRSESQKRESAAQRKELIINQVNRHYK